MKVLFACLKYDYGIASRGISLERKELLPSFSNLGCEVVEFWLEDHGFPNDIDGLQQKLIERAEKENPNLIFMVLMQDEITIQTLDLLKEKYITANWFCDDQWRFNDFSSLIAPHLSYVLTVDKYSVYKYKRIGIKNPILVQWAPVDKDDNYFNASSYECEVSFVGSWNPTREWYVERLRKAGIIVECFGDGWKNGRVTYEEMKRIFHTSKINLNLSNSIPNNMDFYFYLFSSLYRCLFNYSKLKKIIKSFVISFKSTKRIEQLKARMFEIPGFSGFMISQYGLALEDYYSIGKEIAIFSSPEELVRQIRYYLQNDSIRESMRKDAYLRTANYSYTKYIEKFIKSI